MLAVLSFEMNKAERVNISKFLTTVAHSWMFKNSFFQMSRLMRFKFCLGLTCRSRKDLPGISTTSLDQGVRFWELVYLHPEQQTEVQSERPWNMVKEGNQSRLSEYPSIHMSQGLEACLHVASSSQARPARASLHRHRAAFRWAPGSLCTVPSQQKLKPALLILDYDYLTLRWEPG